MGSPPKKLDLYSPYFVSLNLDDLMIGKPSNCSLHHEPLTMSKDAIISAEESSNIIIHQNYPSSSSLPPVIHENPNAKLPNFWGDPIRNPSFSQLEMGSSAEYILGNYLIKTGAIRNVEEEFLHNHAPTKIDQEYLDWQQQAMMDHLLQNQTALGSNSQCFDENKVVDLGDLEKMSVPTGQVVGKSVDSSLESEKNGVSSDEKMKKSDERTQRRMIKNRESAAKSRARKQAYINQLQQNVSQLQTSNHLLRKRKEAETLLKTKPISAPRYQLRRTSSTEF